jgi:hypothetical protein
MAKAKLRTRAGAAVPRYPVLRSPRHFFAGLQVHLSEGFLQPEQTLFSMGLPHFLQGEQPHVWHMVVSFSHASGSRSSGTETRNANSNCRLETTRFQMGQTIPIAAAT